MTNQNMSKSVKKKYSNCPRCKSFHYFNVLAQQCRICGWDDSKPAEVDEELKQKASEFDYYVPRYAGEGEWE
jgi:ribosomal protein L37E